jgi:hypothetical protein
VGVNVGTKRFTTAKQQRNTRGCRGLPIWRPIPKLYPPSGQLRTPNGPRCPTSDCFFITWIFISLLLIVKITWLSLVWLQMPANQELALTGLLIGKWHVCGLQRGPKVTGARNICIGCADVTRASGAYFTQMSRAKFAYDVRHVARVHNANVARTCRARSAQQGMLLLDPSIIIIY